MPRPYRLALAAICLLMMLANHAAAQDAAGTVYEKVFHLPDKFFTSVDNKAEKLSHRLEQAVQRHMLKLSRREDKIRKKLIKNNPLAVKELSDAGLFNDSLSRQALIRRSFLGDVYSSHLDSMRTALNFLQQNHLIDRSPEMHLKLQRTFKGFEHLQEKLNQADRLQNLMLANREKLKQKLQQAGMSRQFGKYQQQIFYYRAQVDEYKKTWEDPQKLEARLLQVISKNRAFQQFFSRNSQLASIFNLPGSGVSSGVVAQGLQTRELLMQELGQRLGGSINMQQSLTGGLKSAQSHLDHLKSQVLRLGKSGEDLEMPRFHPNSQRSKSFFNRLEIGGNMQSIKTSFFFPTSTDFGLSIGYRINDLLTAGVGASYKAGWGRDIRHIAVTHEGIGLRSFADVRFKGNVWISAGAEMNHLTQFKNIQALRSYDSWQHSALLGISKKYSFRKKMNGKFQVMYDFLFRQHVPETQPVIFRFGYGL